MGHDFRMYVVFKYISTLFKYCKKIRNLVFASKNLCQILKIYKYYYKRKETLKCVVPLEKYLNIMSVALSRNNGFYCIRGKKMLVPNKLPTFTC